MNANATNASDPALRSLDALLPDLAELYKDVHSHPELSMQETRTAELAADRLRAAGYEVTTGVGKTGVVGLLRNGDGPTVMLRADMDALPIQEATGLPYASKATATDREGNTVPVSHMCGHDMHVTWLAGATKLLADARTTLEAVWMAFCGARDADDCPYADGVYYAFAVRVPMSSPRALRSPNKSKAGGNHAPFRAKPFETGPCVRSHRRNHSRNRRYGGL